LRGGDGADVLDGQAGADVMRGGGGLDTLTYAARIVPVRVTIGADEGDDGQAGEGDTVSSDIEIVRGGRANDELTGGPSPEELYGRGGDDVLDGGDGAGDLLEGGEGNDLLIDDDRLVDRVFCGGGWDRFQADLLDRVVGCEEAMAIIGETE
jgi:Ca2+-binding RTX toxin-like protein